MGQVAIRSNTHSQFCRFRLFSFSLPPQHNMNGPSHVYQDPCFSVRCCGRLWLSKHIVALMGLFWATVRRACLSLSSYFERRVSAPSSSRLEFLWSAMKFYRCSAHSSDKTYTALCLWQKLRKPTATPIFIVHRLFATLPLARSFWSSLAFALENHTA